MSLKQKLSPTRFQEGLLKRKFRRAGLVEKMARSDLGDLSYWEGGEGEPLVLLHGFGASALWQWYPQVGPLSKAHRLIIPDLLFFGRSQTESPERSLTHQARTVCHLLDELEIEKAHFLGMSYGGFVTYTIATKFRERLNRMILVGCPADVVAKADHQETLQDLGVEHIADLLLPEDPKDLRKLLAIAWHRPPWVPLPFLRDAHRVLMSSQVENKRELLIDLLEYLDGKRSQVPRLPPEAKTLLVWGEHDRIFPLSLAQRLDEKLGELCELCVLEKAAHAPNMERTRLFNRRVLDFLGGT